MNAAIQHLAKICEKERFREKLLFVPSYSLGHQIGEYLAKTGHPWINLRPTTTTGFAQALVSQELSLEGIRLIDPMERLMIVEALYREDESTPKGTRGRYFQGAATIPGILKCLGKAIDEMRMSGIERESLDPGAFIVREKGEELLWLLGVYDDFLKKHQLTDQAGLLRRAVNKIKKDGRYSGESLIMVLSDFPFTELEKELIRLAGGENLIILDQVQPKGLAFPRRFFKPAEKAPESQLIPESNIDLLPWSYDPGNAPDPFNDDSVEMFRSLGESNEVREVFRRIFTEEIPLDEVEVMVVREDPYTAMIYEIAASLGIPVTLSGSIPVTYARPGRAIILFLQWLAEDFPAGYLKRLFTSGSLDLDILGTKGERPSSGMAAKYIREASIGWGRDRYLKRLKALEEHFLSKFGTNLEDSEEEDVLRARKNAEKTAWTARYVEEILNTIPLPDPEGLVSLEEVCQGAIIFLNKFCRVAGELDGAAKIRLEDVLASIEQISSFLEPLKESAERLIEIVNEITIAHSNPKPGHMHISNFRSGGYSGRSRTFLLGVDQNSFPGTLMQDPVILDMEREKLGIVMAGDLLAENLYTMTRMLGSLRGKVTLSYSCRDLREDREAFPSSLLLGIYRVIKNDRTGDFRALLQFLGQPVGYIPQTGKISLNDWEWWLGGKPIRIGTDSILACYENLSKGERAERKRALEELSEHEGWIPSLKDTKDLLTQDLVFSCSRLENLAKCPFAFFIRHLLGVVPLEEMEKDVKQWLGDQQRGSLLHDVFFRFMEALKEKGELPRFEKHFTLLNTIAEEEIERWKDKVPAGSELAFTREVEEIRQALKIFLKDEEEHCQGAEPVWFELSFGIDKDKGQGAIAPVRIQVDEKRSFRLRGRIDRVDRLGPHEYEVWDYKTGSAWGYDETSFLSQGRQLQHALYAQAAEILLRNQGDPKANVIRSGYFFPGIKGEGLRIVREQTDRKKVLDALKDLFELLRSGVFPGSDDDGPCKFCGYQSICGGSKITIPRIKEKINSDKKLEPFRRLKEYA